MTAICGVRISEQLGRRLVIATAVGGLLQLIEFESPELDSANPLDLTWFNLKN
jgi:hypothetical protein